jgi:hypothetical protein
VFITVIGIGHPSQLMHGMEEWRMVTYNSHVREAGNEDSERMFEPYG